MTEHQFIPCQYHLSYGKHPPAQIIYPGDRVVTRIVDAHGFDEHGDKVADSANPLVGPFVIEGAQPGNVLAVSIEKIEPNRRSGWASQSLNPNLFDYGDTEYSKDYVDWELNLEGRTAVPRDQIDPLNRIELPFAPVLGCVGVAPGQSHTERSIDCGRYGGNMDLCVITNGITLYLPVFIKGAYLYFGDGHATQGAGEITGNGIEVSCDLQFSVDVLRTEGYNALRARDQGRVYSIVNARPLEEAFRQATAGMADWLVEYFGFEPRTVGLLMGQVVDYKIGNLVSNAPTVACTIENRFLPGLNG